MSIKSIVPLDPFAQTVGIGLYAYILRLSRFSSCLRPELPQLWCEYMQMKAREL